MRKSVGSKHDERVNSRISDGLAKTQALLMSILSKLKPRFWDHLDSASGAENRHYSFRRKWLMIVSFTTVVTLTPLLVMALVDYRLTRQAFENEARMAVSRAVSNTWRSISFLLSQRKAALVFIARDNGLDALTQPGRLEVLLDRLQHIMGGFIDLDVLDAERNIRACAGFHVGAGSRLEPGNCFDHAVANGFFISDVTQNAGQKHQLVIAIRQQANGEGFFVLRATLDADLFDVPVSQLAMGGNDDVFIVNRQGVLQTPSRYFGKRFEQIPLPVPAEIDGTRVSRTVARDGHPALVGMAPIADSPFVLMMIRHQSDVMDLWLKPRMQLLGFLLFSIVLILASIAGVATYLVNRIHAADQRRVHALHQVEYANKLASIGRLASGVAHEVNNPLAIINQKAGLIKDLLTIDRDQPGNEKLIGLVEAVLASVKRCGAITRRLLDFSRHMEASVETVDIEDVIRQILAFLEKEAERRNIAISVSTRDKIPAFDSDLGNLQQIFLNLINNAFAAMQNGGRLDIAIHRREKNRITVTVADTGHGISEADLKRVFEPFFSTREGNAGTGLGLSVTYGLVSEMGGTIAVESEPDRGTRFTVTLPLTPPLSPSAKNGDDNGPLPKEEKP